MASTNGSGIATVKPKTPSAPISVSADDRRIANLYPDDPASAYHLPTVKPVSTGTVVTPQANSYRPQTIKVNSAPIKQVKATYRDVQSQADYKAAKLLAGTPRSWIEAQQARATTDLAAPEIGGGPGLDYNFTAGGPIGAGVGEIAQQDWGLNAAAAAQAALLMAGVETNVNAAREGAISRGMGRSDLALGVEANARRMGTLDVANTYAQAAAEQGRLNQEVTIASAANQLQREIANQDALIKRDELASAFEELKARLALDTDMANADTQLAYANFNEAKRAAAEAEALARTAADRDYQTTLLNLNQDDRQFGATMGFNYDQLSENSRQFRDRLALDQTTANRGYQMDRLGYNQNERQFGATQDYNYAGLNQQSQIANADMAYKQAQLLSSGYGTQGQANNSVAQRFQEDLPGIADMIMQNWSVAPDKGQYLPSTLIARLEAQYPGIKIANFPQLMALLYPKANGINVPTASSTR